MCSSWGILAAVRLHVLSDLHLERGDPLPPVVDADMLLLGGDIGPGVAGLQAAAQWWTDLPILYVSGNHEPYGGALPQITEQLREAAAPFGDRVRVLEDDEVVIDGVRFLGCTLWSDFEAGGGVQERELSMELCARVVNDYRYVSWSPEDRKLRPEDTLGLHRASRRWLEDRLAEPFDGQTVVMTHHGPLAPPFRISNAVRRAVAGAFVSDLSDLIGADRVDLWVYGHTHRVHDADTNGTRVLSNPRGYPQEPAAGFDPALVVEV
jgi:predicted phosphohydrolase